MENRFKSVDPSLMKRAPKKLVESPYLLVKLKAKQKHMIFSFYYFRISQGRIWCSRAAAIEL
jgi:hypothetical protein